MKKLSLLLLLMLGTVLNPWSANATDCVATPDCASLGYTKNATDCKDKVAVKCPTDNTKVFCKDEVAVQAPLPILYGDGTVTKELVAGKTPIGVVFDTANRLAVALTDVKKDGTAGSETMEWSSNFCDTPGLQNCTATEIPYGTNLTPITCGVDGRLNTNAILASSCNGTTYAATATNNYQPTGCAKDFCKKSKWFLPSIRDLQNIYLQKTQIDASLTLLKSNGATDIGTKYYWSSTETNNNYVWLFDMAGGNRNLNGTKYINGSYVRPVINYGAPKPAQNIKFAINISNSCPSGLSFSGSYQGSTMGTFSCSGASCYDQGRYDGQGSNDSETVVKEGTSITLSNLNSNFTSIKSMVTGKIVPVSGGMAYFALNNSDEILAALGPGAYDFWMLQCSPVAIAKASVTAEVIVTGSSSNMFVDLNGTSVTCTVTATEDGRSAPVAINGGKTTNSFAAGQVTLACPRTIKPSTGSYTQYRISESEVDNGGRQTLNGLSVRVNATPNGSHTLKIYYQAI